MNTVSLVGSVSRRAGGLFESVRRLHRELLAQNAHSEATSASDTEITVQVLSLRDEFTEADVGDWEPVSVHVFDGCAPKAFGFTPGLIPKLLTLKPDLVHVHGLWQFTSVAALSWHRKTNRPYLISPHGMLDNWAIRNSRWKKTVGWLAYERSHLESAACVRALCQAEADAIRDLGLVNPICIIPNGVELPDEAEEKRKAGNRESGKPLGASNGGSFSKDSGNTVGSSDCLSDNRKVLLYLGRIHPKKGLENLLKAWARVQSSHDWLLIIAGWDQGGHERRLKRLANQLAVRWADGQSRAESESAVVFAGPQFGAAKDNWLRRCDAVILPSFSEGIPIAVLEAWARAKPVLMTPQCNLPEGFAAGAALCIDPEPEAIAAGLREFFRLECWARKQMGVRGRALVSRRFAWPKIAADLRAVYYWMTGIGSKPDCVLIH
jgi:glycosyltransferase involved in cell wall biosynthesis